MTRSLKDEKRTAAYWRAQRAVVREQLAAARIAIDAAYHAAEPGDLELEILALRNEIDRVLREAWRPEPFMRS